MSRNGNGGGRWDAERFLREQDQHEEPQPSRRARGRSVAIAERERSREPVDRKGRSFVEDYLRPQEKTPALSEALIPYKERRRPSRSPARSTSRAPPAMSRAPPREASEREFRRPTLLRRQSSLDTFDRAANRRVQDYSRWDREEDYGPPVIPVAPRRRAASRVRPVEPEPELDEISVAEPDYYGDERFRKIRQQERERSSTPRGRRNTLREQVVHEKVESRPFPHRGRTRIPKRFVHPRALIDLGYPYDDEVWRTSDNFCVFVKGG